MLQVQIINVNFVCLTSNDNKAVQFCLQSHQFANVLNHILNPIPCDVVAEISITLCRHQMCAQSRPATGDGRTEASLYSKLKKKKNIFLNFYFFYKKY